MVDKQQYAEWLALGICPRCGKNPLMEKRKLCFECSNKRTKYTKNYWLKNCSEEVKKRRADVNKRWALENPERAKARCVRYRKRLRDEVINHYGGKCVCCGESNIAFLTIDHINGGGNAHRRELFGENVSKRFYAWLRRNKYPVGFQTLCWNCNVAKAHLGVCPHKAKAT